MKKLISIGASGLALLVSPQPIHAQQGAGVPGFMYADGSFRPAVARRTTVTATTAPNYTGSITLTLTVVIVSSAATIDRSAPVKCILDAAVGGSDSVNETMQTYAPISGTQAVCKMTIPYAWYLANPQADYVTLGYNVSLFDQNGHGRTTYMQIPTIAVPANGATTSYTRTGRL